MYVHARMLCVCVHTRVHMWVQGQELPPMVKDNEMLFYYPPLIRFSNFFSLSVQMNCMVSGQNWKVSERMGLEAGKPRNKMDGGLTTLTGWSDSNTFAKLTVKVKDNIVQNNTNQEHLSSTQPAFQWK